MLTSNDTTLWLRLDSLIAMSPSIQQSSCTRCVCVCVCVWFPVSLYSFSLNVLYIARFDRGSYANAAVTLKLVTCTQLSQAFYTYTHICFCCYCILIMLFHSSSVLWRLLAYVVERAARSLKFTTFLSFSAYPPELSVHYKLGLSLPITKFGWFIMNRVCLFVFVCAREIERETKNLFDASSCPLNHVVRV